MKRVTGLLALGAALLLAACAAPPPQVVRIGIAGPLTGPIGHLGLDNERGARLAVEELNQRQVRIGGRPVLFELLSQDDRADPREGVAAAQRLVAAKVNGVVGHLNSGTSIPAGKVYVEAGLPAISPSASNPRLTRQGWRTAFRVVVDDSNVGRLMGRDVGAASFKAVAIVDDRTAYGQGMADAFVAGLRESGAAPRDRFFTTDKATVFTTLAQQITQAQADAIFFGGMDFQAAGLLEALVQQGWQGQFLGGDGICTSLLAKARLASQVLCAEPGGLVDDQGSSAMREFLQRFRTRFGVDVQVYAPQAYDAVRVLADAMQRAGSADPAQYLPALSGTRDFPGVSGSIGFDAKGDLLAPVVPLYTYRDGRRVFARLVR